jgi:hypothetical protein
VNTEKLRVISERVDLMSLRERVFVLVAAVVVILALVQTLLIDAGQVRKQSAHDRVQAADAALVQIGQQRQLLAGQGGARPGSGRAGCACRAGNAAGRTECRA